MTRNIGSTDRLIRIIAGIALIAWAILGSSPMAWIGWIGIVPLATALLGWCPPYQLLGINTCKVKK